MTRRNLTAALALSLLFGLLPGDALAGKKKKTSAPPPPPNTVQGGAFGIYSDLDIAGLALNIEPTPIVALPSTGGNVADAVVALQLAGVIEVATLGVSSSGTVGPTLAKLARAHGSGVRRDRLELSRSAKASQIGRE